MPKMPKIGNRLVRWWATFCVAILGVVGVVTGGTLFTGVAYGLGLLVSEGGLDETFAWGLLTLVVIILVSIGLGFIVWVIDQIGNMLFDSAAATVEKKAIPSSS